MVDLTFEIYALASEIEWMQARERCRLNGKFRRCTGRRSNELKRQAVAAEYDPLAATCLAELIERRLFPSPTQDETRR